MMNASASIPVKPRGWIGAKAHMHAAWILFVLAGAVMALRQVDDWISAGRSPAAANRLPGRSIVTEARATSAPDLAAVGLDPEARAAGAGEEWSHTVTANLARAEYQASLTGQGLQAPNRAHNLRTTFGERGIQVVPRTNQEVVPAWRFAWEASGFGRRDRMEAVAPAAPAANGARVTYRRDGWSEWYENTPQGLEQGFTIERKPAGNGSLCIAGEFPAGLHPELQPDGAIDFIDAHGARVLRYGELKVWDARRAELKAELLVAGTTLTIAIDDRDAAYPLLVDPLLTSPSWTAESNQASANFGWSVGTAGDVNGDGFSDVIVGAYHLDNGEVNEGRAYVYHGSASGLSSTPSWTAEGNQPNAQFGYSVGTAGDVNGDGFSDVIVSANLFDNGESEEGRAFVYHGSASGLSPTPSWTAEGNQTGANFGWSVATAGDVNADGFSDVIVGADQYDGATEPDEGRVFIYHGSASGLSAGNGSRRMGDNRPSAHFGFSVRTAGDVNGDGFSDVIVGAIGADNGENDEGMAVVYHGSAIGLSSSFDWTAESNQANAFFGWSVGTAGDVNGDGYADVLVGAISYDNGETNEGRIYLYYGQAAGLNTTPAYTAESNQAFAEFGCSVALAGDVNGDGYSDVLFGADSYDNGQTNEGRAFLYLGGRTGLFCCTPDWTAESDQGGALFGTAVGTAGDVNGDGYSDVIVGGLQYDNGQTDEGRAFVYHGSATGPSIVPSVERESNQAGAHFGYSVSAAGDVNGDGYSDVIVGAPHFDNGESDEGRAYVYLGFSSGLFGSPAWTAEADQAVAIFGYSVATAGDVNGDGYSDVIVGSPFYDNDESGEGRAYVYHGSPTGLSPVPNWIGEGNQALASFGGSVATAGDVNGDGYSDVIVGGTTFDNGQANEGRALVYLGSATGLAATPAWSAESDQEMAQFGWSVSTAGDVNGDGFSDVVVSAVSFDNGEINEGRAFVYHGSAAGLSLTSAWTAESNQPAGDFGFSVATAGDVNGDGFSDVIVGSQDYDNGQTNEGRAYVYQGSAGGLAATPAWTAESNQAGAHFGYSAGTAGDMNGDSYSDVIVGAYSYDNNFSNAGRAFFYAGSAAGLASSPAWTADGHNPDDFFGFSVAAAGDVNGDAFSDVLVGVEAFSNGQSEEGRALVFSGNDTQGIDRRVRQARTDDSAPIALLGSSNSSSAFALKILGRTAVGRAKVQLQFEVKPLGVPFDGTGLVTGPVVDTGAPIQNLGSAVLLTEVASGLAADTPYRWRLRTLANSPFIPATPWFSLSYNNVTETDVRTASPQTGIASSEAPAAQRAMLEPVRPNPLRTHGEIAYTLTAAGEVRLTVVDVAGRVRAVLADGSQIRGRHTARWDARDRRGAELASGIYFLRLESAGGVQVQKVVIAR